MVVHWQLVKPAVCLSDLYAVFLLDIVRDTRQNLWTMIYRSQWPHWQCQTEQVSKVWCISELFFRGVCVGGGGGGGGVGARISEIFFYKESGKWIFLKKNPNLKKKILACGRGGSGGVARVSVFFFFKRIQVWIEKKFWGGEDKGGLASFLFFFWGGGGGVEVGVGGGEIEIFFY